MEAHVSIKIEASKDSGRQMTPQGTMWHLYSKSQLEEEASVLQSQGVKDFYLKKFMLLCYARYK